MVTIQETYEFLSDFDWFFAKLAIGWQSFGLWRIKLISKSLNIFCLSWHFFDSSFFIINHEDKQLFFLQIVNTFLFGVDDEVEKWINFLYENHLDVFLLLNVNNSFEFIFNEVYEIWNIFNSSEFPSIDNHVEKDIHILSFWNLLFLLEFLVFFLLFIFWYFDDVRLVELLFEYL